MDMIKELRLAGIDALTALNCLCVRTPPALYCGSNSIPYIISINATCTCIDGPSTSLIDESTYLISWGRKQKRDADECQDTQEEDENQELKNQETLTLEIYSRIIFRSIIKPRCGYVVNCL